MKKILLSALASLLMMSASAQPAEGPRAPQGFRGPQPHFFAPEGMPDFEALKDFKAPEGFRAVKFDAPSDFQGPRGFRAPQGPQGPKGPRGFRAPQGPQGPKGPRGFHPGPDGKKFEVVELSAEEVAQRFARRLHLDEEKTADFAPIFTAYRADVKAAEDENPITFKPQARRAPKAEKPTEAEIEEMKAEREQFAARDKAVKAVRDDYKDSFLEVLNPRQLHWMFRLERDRGLFVKFVPTQEEEKTEEQPAATRGLEGLTDAIETVGSDKADNGEWHAINGVALKEQPTQAGIYVKDGKKVLVR